MDRLTRWTAPLILATATLHTLAAAAQPEWADFARSGLWNTVSSDDDAAMSTLWFGLAGLGMYGIGLLTRRHTRDTGRVPAETGWTLLALGVPMTILEPVSGGWLVIAVGTLALAAARRASAGHAAVLHESPAACAAK